MNPLDAALLALSAAGLLVPLVTVAQIANDKRTGKGAWADTTAVIVTPEVPPLPSDAWVVEIGKLVPIIFVHKESKLSGVIEIREVELKYQHNAPWSPPYDDPPFYEYRAPTVTGAINFRFVPPNL